MPEEERFLLMAYLRKNGGTRWRMVERARLTEARLELVVVREQDEQHCEVQDHHCD